SHSHTLCICSVLPPSLSLSHTPSLPPSLTHSLSHTHSHSPRLSHTHSLSPPPPLSPYCQMQAVLAWLTVEQDSDALDTQGNKSTQQVQIFHRDHKKKHTPLSLSLSLTLSAFH